MTESPLKETALKNAAGINGKSSRLQRLLKNTAAPITLTSLVDAFSILVIYLLVNFSNAGEILYVDNQIELPAAAQVETLERTTIVKVLDQKIFVESDEVLSKDLVAHLIERREAGEKDKTDGSQEESLIIQADKKVKYEMISQVVQASHHAGFGEIRFAVLTK